MDFCKTCNRPLTSGDMFALEISKDEYEDVCIFCGGEIVHLSEDDWREDR